MKQDHDEPAFPVPFGQAVAHFAGMSLRDWFAGVAMQGFSANPDEECISWTPETAARISYAMADEMMKAREA